MPVSEYGKFKASIIITKARLLTIKKTYLLWYLWVAISSLQTKRRHSGQASSVPRDAHSVESSPGSDKPFPFCMIKSLILTKTSKLLNYLRDPQAAQRLRNVLHVVLEHCQHVLLPGISHFLPSPQPPPLHLAFSASLSYAAFLHSLPPPPLSPCDLLILAH